ncbi:uncharacterized protein CBL_10861 [Carabus blaptoides fortunei]
MFCLTILSIVLVQFVIWISVASGDDVKIKINNGQLLGVKSVTVFNTPFCFFAGIPYARPPIGNLRFEAPLPARNWTGILNATTEGEDCTSTVNNSVVGSEDCLFVNVYTPQLPSNTTNHPKLPVIVWIHGGGFIFGSGNLGLHGADRFLIEGVLIVSVSYRLGVFVAKGLFQKAIFESGSGLNPWTQAKCPRELAFRIALLNGVYTVNSTKLKLALRNINYVKLQNSITLPTILDLYDPLNGLPFAPVIEPPSDDAVLTGYSYSTLNTGNFSRVPVLFGYNSLEARVAQNLPWFGILLLEQYNVFRSRLTPLDMHATAQGNSAAGRKISKFYFNYGAVVPDASLVRYLSDDQFVRGIMETAKLQSQFVPSYLYRFAFTGGIAHESFQPEGVSHAEELQFLWLSNTTVQKTAAAQLTVARMIQLWTNFAKTGNPTPYLNDIVNVTWPVVNATGGQDVHYLNIDTVLEAKVNPDENAMEFWDNLYKTYGNEPYNTY